MANSRLYHLTWPWFLSHGPFCPIVLRVVLRLVKLKDETPERWPTIKQQVCLGHLLSLYPMDRPCGNFREKTF